VTQFLRTKQNQFATDCFVRLQKTLKNGEGEWKGRRGRSGKYSQPKFVDFGIRLIDIDEMQFIIIFDALQVANPALAHRPVQAGPGLATSWSKLIPHF
jgi:hypothetical protein